MDEFYWKKIPKTSEKNYISRWESLNIPRKNDMADWHPMTYLKTDDEREEIQTYTLDETIGNTGIEHIEIRFPQKAKVYISDYVRAVIDLIVTSDFFMIKTLFGCREDFFSEEQEKELFKRLMKILKNNHKEGEKIKYFLENEFPAWYYKEIGYLEDVGSLEEKTSLNLFSLEESVQSSKIEGTQATFTDVIESNATGINNVHIQEVKNYIEALSVGTELLKTLPISTRLLNMLHTILLKNSRGHNKSPGEYRKIENFIGSTNRREDATYIPPEPQYIPDLISNLEKYINEDISTLDPLIKSAIIHAQFESIHPYLDGNGRLGRVLIMLYLLYSEVISQPSFFISEELERNRFKYYRLLNDLRTDDPKWIAWIDFFLDCAIKQADKYLIKLDEINKYYKEAIKYASDNNVHIDYINIMFKKIAFTSKDIKEVVNSSYGTINRNLKKLIEGGYIDQDDKKRNKVYRAYDLLSILSR